MGPLTGNAIHLPISIEQLNHHSAKNVDDRYSLLPQHLQDSIQSLDALNNEDIPEVAWIVPDLITEGFTILAGYLKSGKSYLILNIGVAIAEGLLVLGETKVDQGRVLYITPDDKQKARIRARIRKMRLGRNDSIPLDVVRSWRVLDKGGVDDLRAYLDVFPETKLVIIDVLMNVLPDIKEDANAYSKIYEKLPPLKNLAQEKHIAIVAVMHTKKPDNDKGTNPRSAIYGSQAYGAIADNLLIIDEDYSTHKRSLMTYGKDVDEGKIDLEFSANTGIYTYGQKRKEQLQELNASRTVEAIVSEHPGCTYIEMVNWLMTEQGIKKPTAEQRVTRAANNGKICKELDGKYYPGNCKPDTVDDMPDDLDLP